MKQHISGISIAHSRELDNRLSWFFKVFPMWLLGLKLRCMVRMVLDSILPHAESGPGQMTIGKTQPTLELGAYSLFIL